MLDIHNSIHVIVFNCSFLHNCGTRVIQEPYCGNTGALSTTYNLSSSASNHNITVTSYNFINNSALATVSFRATVRSFGGSLYFLFKGCGETHSCRYLNNLAQDGGGGIVLVGTKGTLNAPHTFYAINCTFIGNKALHGAGLYYSLSLNGGYTNVAHLEGNNFTYNSLLNDRDGFGAAIVMEITDNYEEKDFFPVNIISN